MKIVNIKTIISIIVLIAVVLFPVFEHSPYYLDLVITVMMNALLAVTFIILLRAGLLSLGIAAFWGIGSYISAILSLKFHLSFWLCLPLSAIITGLIALIIGMAILKNTGFSFVMLSAVIGMLFPVVVGYTPYLGGYTGMPNIPPPGPINIPFLPAILFSSKETWYFLMLAILIIIVLVVMAFNAAWTGRAWVAIGMNRRLAGTLGINAFRYKITAFVLASAIAGFVGSFYAHYMTFINPNTFGIWTVVYIQIYAILGGIGHVIAGPLIGAAIMTFFPEFIRQTQNLAPLIVGLLLIVLIIFLPQGLLSIPQRWPILMIWFSKLGNTIKSRLSRIRMENT